MLTNEQKITLALEIIKFREEQRYHQSMYNATSPAPDDAVHQGYTDLETKAQAIIARELSN